MNIATILTHFSLEVDAFRKSGYTRSYLVNRIGEMIDAIVVDKDLPGPDFIVVPLLRASLQFAAGQLWDVYNKAVANGNDLVWPALPDSETTDASGGE
jgi:hypothetical protein